jgi:hypothetical protein
MKLRLLILVLLGLLLSGCASPASTAVSPSPSAVNNAKPVVTVFRVSPELITTGQKAMLQWEVSGISTVRINPELGNVGASGSIEVRPFTTTTYTLTAGEQANKVTATATLTVEITVPVVEFFIADPREIYFGNSGTLRWNVIGATSVSIDHNIGTVAASGSVTVTPATSTAYILTATNAEGTVTATTAIINTGRIFGN